MSTLVPGFLPSTRGFRFANDFPHVPVRRIGVSGVLSIPIGDASNGLCGGMAFAVRDYFEAGREPPADTSAPGSGPLFDYLCDRLFDSFDLPLGPARYLELMSPLLADGEGWWSRMGLAPHGRAWRMVCDEWPRVRTDIDAGHPSPLGLIEVKSSNPMDLKHDHQVLAYGYDLIDGVLTLRICRSELAGARRHHAVAQHPRPHATDDRHVVGRGVDGVRVLPRELFGEAAAGLARLRRRLLRASGRRTAPRGCRCSSSRARPWATAT